MKKLIVSAILIVLSYSLNAQAQEVQYSVHNNINYRITGVDNYADSVCLIDLYHPVDTEGFPTVIWFHSGGLTGGGRHIPEALKEKGFAVAGVGYRFATQVPVTDIIDDAAAAAAWIVRNIDKYGGDPDKVYVAGHSAGGYLTAMIGLDKRWLAPYGIDPDTAFAALIPYSGQSIVHFEERKNRGMPATQPLVNDMAPMYHVRADSAPIYIISGDRELEMNGRYEENAFFWRLFMIAGHPDARIVELDGFNHGDMALPGHLLTIKYIREKEKNR